MHDSVRVLQLVPLTCHGGVPTPTQDVRSTSDIDTLTQKGSTNTKGVMITIPVNVETLETPPTSDVPRSSPCYGKSWLRHEDESEQSTIPDSQKGSRPTTLRGSSAEDPCYWTLGRVKDVEAITGKIRLKLLVDMCMNIKFLLS